MQWDDAVRALGGVPRPTDLAARYAEPHRRYHDTRHVHQVVLDADMAILGATPPDYERYRKVVRVELAAL